ncbi:hypothetical protein, partial [Pseudomonas syringae group genomosp. 7]|uniref:hypothetical protein n=1 Tax=Pseudomonas syringae group genomosp. 7 TaxID=251699 RepID=UPI00376F61B1
MHKFLVDLFVLGFFCLVGLFWFFGVFWGFFGFVWCCFFGLWGCLLVLLGGVLCWGRLLVWVLVEVGVVGLVVL